MIRKIGAAIISDGKLMVVSKKTSPAKFMLPGGKPEPGETDIETLKRELLEEINVNVVSAKKIGEFDTTSMLEPLPLSMTIFLTEVDKVPHPGSEIEHVKWVDYSDINDLSLGTGVTKFALPKLREMGLL